MKQTSVILAFLLGLTAVGAQPSRGPNDFDIILRGGTIVDGTGLRRYDADVAIRSGRIARIGELRGARARLELDVTGLFVTPGFINTHSHASADALPRAENMLTQGVTTEILNPDGGGPTDLTAQLARLAGGGLALNVGAFIGFNSIWQAVVGPADRRPSPDEIERMRGLVTTGLEQGAWGVSAGLDYKPAYFAKTAEVVQVVEVAKYWRTNFPNHDRLTPETNYSSRAGIAETIDIGAQAGLIPVVTHMKAQGVEQGTAPRLLEIMSQATATGRYTAADAYPYLAGQTGLGALIIPAWAQDGGREAMLQRFKQPAVRARIIAEAEQGLKARFGGPQGVYLPATRRELTDVMREWKTPAGETIVRLLEQADNTSAILRFGSEPDLVKILQHPTTSIACDCGASNSTRTHPRYYGTFPRVLGRYVRQTNTLTWEDAVRKMSALPAATIGMVDRGYLAPGMAADVTVFDPKTVIDHATYEDPSQLSEGIRHVIVNGVVALRAGQITGEAAGHALTRTIHMPSRPMTIGAAAGLSIKGKLEGTAVSVALDITQRAAAPRAAGSLRIEDPKTKMRVDASDFGPLQMSGSWASVTAYGRVRPGSDSRAITVILDTDAQDLSRAILIVDVEDVYHVAGALDPRAVKRSAR
jgi:N-acyl-D-amino-acid deacylase